MKYIGTSTSRSTRRTETGRTCRCSPLRAGASTPCTPCSSASRRRRTGRSGSTRCTTRNSEMPSTPRCHEMPNSGIHSWNETNSSESGCLPVEIDEQSDAQCSVSVAVSGQEPDDERGAARRSGPHGHERGEDRKSITGSPRSRTRPSSAPHRRQRTTHSLTAQLAELPGRALDQARDTHDRAVDDLLVDDLGVGMGELAPGTTEERREPSRRDQAFCSNVGSCFSAADAVLQPCAVGQRGCRGSPRRSPRG